MNLRNPFLTALLILLTLSGFPQTSGVKIITLDECLKLSLENSSKLKISKLEEHRLFYQVKETRGKGLPDISFSGGYDDYLNIPTQLLPGVIIGRPGELIPVQFGTTYNLSGALQVSQLLYNQTFLAALKMARQVVEKGRLETEKAKNEVVYNVAQSYYMAQITRKQVKNLESNLENLEKAEKIAKSQYEGGLIKKIDVDRIRVNRLNVLTEKERLDVLYEQQLSMLRYFMGMEQDQLLVFPDSVYTTTINPEMQVETSNHIDIRLIGMQRKLALTNLSMNRADYYPSLTLIGNTSYLNQTNSFYFYGKPSGWFNTSLVGIRLNVPIFNGMQKRSRISQSKVALLEINETEADTRKLLGIQMQDAGRKLLNSIRAEQRQRDNQTLAGHVFSVSQEQYQKGVIPLTDLLNAESELSNAQTGHVTALVQMKLAELEYLKSNGKLLDVLVKTE
ncbi:MAG: TolC family protein [Bacteroidetes bacterium]|nr:TolC family protein [Bacteroidota bacterium]